MKRENAYFTVEAALVFPVVMGAVLFVIYMLLFQYDRCLLEQDLGAIALWGSCQAIGEGTELEEKVRERITGLYQDKYAAWEITELKVSVEKNCFSVQGSGRIIFPVPGWNFWSEEDVWDISAHYSCSRLSPVTFIRLCHRFREHIDRVEDADRNVYAER